MFKKILLLSISCFSLVAQQANQGVRNPWPSEFDTQSLAVTANATIGGTATVTGAATFNGTTTINGVSALTNKTSFSKALNTNPTGCDDYARYSFGAFVPGGEFGGCSVPIQQGIVAGMVVPDNSPSQLVCAVCIYEVGPGGTSSAESTVALFALGSPQSANNEGTWAANFTVFNYPTLPAMSTAGLAGNLVGLEVDYNTSATGVPPTTGAGVEAVSAAFQAPTGFYSAFQAQILAFSGYAKFKVGYNSFEDCCTVAFEAGQATATGASASQLTQWQSRTSGNATLVAQQYEDQSGFMTIQSATGAGIVLGDISADQFDIATAAALTLNNVLIPRIFSATPTSLGSTLPQLVYCSGCTINACATPGTGSWEFFSPATAAWKCPF